ncbi:Hypothetical Protein FCC1311_045662 [Hondaea fermentalgiana]|uniref:Uncharacterized protein n=1 Tax=Hondaea fermentalgiana TaxID=2315210 RepID=A0A2R5GI59_9STRA|nr:Hypothetical Protein FCC1311_045662 [Hondaea fermentalgiana]|eukprot:GBG28343.1 Hypothetical Protein FCC1311_045662 [Hondaea fermentalgiana]
MGELELQLLPVKKRRLAELRLEAEASGAGTGAACTRNKRRDPRFLPQDDPENTDPVAAAAAAAPMGEDLRERAINLEAALRVSNKHFSRACEDMKNCSVCEIEFESQDARIQSVTSIAKRVDDIKRRRRAHSPLPHFVSQREHNLRLRQGVSVYMRQMKAAILTRKRCPACRRDFTFDELAGVLKMMDRKTNPLFLSLTSSLVH